jgi:hypothetical protein
MSLKRRKLMISEDVNIIQEVDKKSSCVTRRNNEGSFAAPTVIK